MKYFNDPDLVLFTIATGVAVWAVCKAIAGLGELALRLVDRKIPGLAVQIAYLATRMLPKAERDSGFYNFEADAHDALDGGHHYSATMTAARSLIVVVPRMAFRNVRRTTPALVRQDLADEMWLVANDPVAILAVQLSPNALVGFGVGYLSAYCRSWIRVSRIRKAGQRQDEV
ncbi:MAG: hypothetical protein WA988_01400 [Candidatus Nanopelagicales bacterium]